MAVEKSTYEVEELLSNMKPAELGSFYKENRSSMVDDKKAFYYYMKDIKCTPANADHVLYILEDLNKKGTDEIKFTDFRGSDIENPDTYTINLVPTITGTGKNVKSSFYINVVKKDAEGNVLMTKKVGTPSITRKGVSNYKIERIFCDKSERNLIFVIEKMFEDDSGISIRYMVEAAQF